LKNIPSQKVLADIADINVHQLRVNIRLLLAMVLKRGYTVKESIVIKMNRETIKAKKNGFGR